MNEVAHGVNAEPGERLGPRVVDEPGVLDGLVPRGSLVGASAP